MDIQIDFRPSNTAAKVKLHSEGGTEAGMIAMSGNIELETSTHKGKGGILSGIKRMFAGKLFLITIKRSEPGEVW